MASGSQVSEQAGVQIGVSSVTKLVIEEESAEIGPSSEIKEAAVVIGVENGVSENQLTVVGLKQDTSEAGGLDGANLGKLVTEDGGIKEIVGVVGFVNGTALENQLAGSCIGGETGVAHSNQVNAEEQVVDGQIAVSSANQETAVVLGVAGENRVASEDQVNAEEQSVGGENGFPSSNQVDADKQADGGEIWVSSANQEAGVVVGISGENGVAFADQVISESENLDAETWVASANRVNGEAGCVGGENEMASADCVNDEPGNIGGETAVSLQNQVNEAERGVGGESGLASANLVTGETRCIGGEIEGASMNHVIEEAEGIGFESGMASANQATGETERLGGEIEGGFMNLVTEEAGGIGSDSGVASANQVNGQAEGDGGENGAPSFSQVAGRAVGVGGEIRVQFANQVNGVAEGVGGEIGVTSVNAVAGKAAGCCESLVPAANQLYGIAEGVGGIGMSSSNQVTEEAVSSGGEAGMFSSSQVNVISEGVGGRIEVPFALQMNGCIGGEFGVVQKNRWGETKVYRRRPKGEKNKGVLRDITTIPATKTTLQENGSRNRYEKMHLGEVNTCGEENHNDNHLDGNGVTGSDNIVYVPSSGDITVDVVSNKDLNAAAVDIVTPISVDPLVTNSALNPLSSPSDGKVKVNFSSTAKLELRQLKRKFESELYSVRKAVKKMDGGREEIVPAVYHPLVDSNLVFNGAKSNGFATHVYSGTRSLGHVPYKPNIRPFNQLRVSVVENSHGMVDSIEREKRTPKANTFYRNSEFLLANDKFPPAESNKKSKSNGQRSSGGEFSFGVGSKVFKSCAALLEKLMKHKHGWVFNAPVDVKALGLHDYFLFVKNPMDLGTMKARLIKYSYKSPMEFAEDVRLTFNNAMLYNSKGHDVHIMAETLLKIFEGKWPDIEVKYLRELRSAVDHDMGFPTPTSKLSNPFHPQVLPPLETRMFSRSESMPHPANPKPRTLTPAPSFKTPALQKPKAKDVNKREMTYGEKQKLSTNLQDLPPEKLDGVIQIIKKRSTALSQNDDEIEVDIDSVDTETLWELDRYVSNYKKSLSKHRRKAELANQMRAEARLAVEKTTSTKPVPPKESTTGYENATLPPPPHQNNPAANANGSRSSSSSGSSSSDSDSDSSSEESDGGHSPKT